jgi:hypothetical protein
MQDQVQRRVVIEGFLKNHDPPFDKVKVAEYRKIVKVFFTYVINTKSDYHHDVKKGDGLWEVMPIFWKKEVPFLDPNNGSAKKGADKKPNQEKCRTMLTYLHQ